MHARIDAIMHVREVVGALLTPCQTTEGKSKHPGVLSRLLVAMQ